MIDESVIKFILSDDYKNEKIKADISGRLQALNDSLTDVKNSMDEEITGFVRAHKYQDAEERISLLKKIDAVLDSFKPYVKEKNVLQTPETIQTSEVQAQPAQEAFGLVFKELPEEPEDGSDFEKMFDKDCASFDEMFGRKKR